MLKTRLIPVLLLQNGVLVRSETFSVHQVIGYPVNEVQRFNEWNVDELIYLDITRGGDAYDVGRDDHKVTNVGGVLDVLDAIAPSCFVPLTFGGGIRTVEDMRERFRRGADKISINTAAFETPELIREGAQAFGAQAIVVAMDVRRDATGTPTVAIDGARNDTGMDPVTWALEAERLGAGEILLGSVDRDGTGVGYDLDLIASVTAAVRIPVIALGGVGTYEQLPKAVTQAGASAVAAANIFHFKELSDRNAKRAMRRAGLDVRL